MTSPTVGSGSGTLMSPDVSSQQDGHGHASVFDSQEEDAEEGEEEEEEEEEEDGITYK
jgi:hypothetical protein